MNVKKPLPYSLYALLVLVPIILIHLYIYHPNSFAVISNRSRGNEAESAEVEESCDYGDGEWVMEEDSGWGLLYNGTTCETIKRGRNCMVSGRPDRDYLKWRWKPRRCNLLPFDPGTFLDLMKNKHLAFVGDSLARNQMESLLCMVATVEKPHLFYEDGEDSKFRRWSLPSRNANLSIYWSPFLVKGIEKTMQANSEANHNTVFLDSVDERCAGELRDMNILVMSIGHWFLHSAVYYHNNSVFGCHSRENCTETGFYDSFKRALKTTLDEIIRRKQKQGVPRKHLTVFLTTFSPAHFEGEWDKLGSCSKTQPYHKSEQKFEGMNAEMREIGMEQVQEAGAKSGSEVSIEALDVSELSLLRPDGHPGPYMHPFPFANGVQERVQNDCVHWCLPGPIDTWNQILLHFRSQFRFPLIASEFLLLLNVFGRQKRSRFAG